MTIQRALVADAPEIAAVHVATWQAAYRGLLPENWLDKLSVDDRAAMWTRVLEEGQTEVYVMRVDGSLVGFVAYGPARRPDAAAGTGEIHALYVLPEYWSTGLGLALCHGALRRLAELGFSRVELEVLAGNDRGIRFYERMGFARSEAAETMIDIGDRAYAEVRYERVVP